MNEVKIRVCERERERKEGVWMMGRGVRSNVCETEKRAGSQGCLKMSKIVDKPFLFCSTKG